MSPLVGICIGALGFMFSFYIFVFMRGNETTVFDPSIAVVDPIFITEMFVG